MEETLKNLILLFAFSFVLMLLWNWILPDITKGGVTMISYWQAVGLMVLSNLLFKGGGDKTTVNIKAPDDEFEA